MSLARNLKSRLSAKPAEVRSRSDCSFVHGTQNRQLRNDPGREEVLGAVGDGDGVGKPQQTFQKCQEVWSRSVVPLHRSQAAGAGAQRIGARQFEQKKKWMLPFCKLQASELRSNSTMTMTMTHSEKSHIRRMKAWPHRQECRGHDSTKKKLFH